MNEACGWRFGFEENPESALALNGSTDAFGYPKKFNSLGKAV
jgi:hypothetical protein